LTPLSNAWRWDSQRTYNQVTLLGKDKIVRRLRSVLILVFLAVTMLAIVWLLAPALQPDPTGEPESVAPTVPTVDLSQPAILTFTGREETCMDHVPCAAFEWTTRGATSVTIESGAVENGLFEPGGWDRSDNLPPNGSYNFIMKIGNYAARLCFQTDDASAEALCAVCDPSQQDSCQ
jgi:hypothetical protein